MKAKKFAYMKDSAFVVECPHCGAKQTTEIEKQPDFCSQCDKWYRVRSQIEHRVRLIITKENRSDSKVHTADNPPPGEKESK